MYIFIDEAGNFDFSPNGTKHFVLTSVSTLYPLKERLSLLRLRYELLKSGLDQDIFHATEDKQTVRDQVYACISGLDDIEVDAVIVQKNKANPSLYLEVQPQRKGQPERKVKVKHSGHKLYKMVSQTLLQYIFRRYEPSEKIDEIVVVLGAIFTRNKREYILKSLKQYLKREFQKPFYVYFHSVQADINCQIADYCGWALYVKAERNEVRPIEALRGKVKSTFDIFQRGTTIYYKQNK